MKGWLGKLWKAFAYFAAGVVILLAIAVGVFRLMLPRLPEYQAEIKGWASTAIGMQVYFSGMTARWRLSGPELTFFDARLHRADSVENILSASEVSIGVGLLRLIGDRELVVDRVTIRDSAIDVAKDEDGNWLVQGMPIDAILESRDVAPEPGGDFEITAQDIDVLYEHPGSGQLVPFTVLALNASRDDELLAIEADVALPDDFGNRLEVSAEQLPAAGSPATWRFFAEGDDLALAGWSRLLPVGFPEVASGTADLSVWVDAGRHGVESATLGIDISDLDAAGPALASPFSLRGTFEYSTELDGWLLAATGFRMITADGTWPETEITLRIVEDDDEPLNGLRATANYLNLDDIRYLLPWLGEERRALLARYAPSGEVRDLALEILELPSGEPQYDIAAEFENAGFAAGDTVAGVRGFSGRVRADRSGGRVEMLAPGLVVDTADLLPEPMVFDEASGTVIWRRNRDGIIVLSDAVTIRNADLESQMSLQIGIPDDATSPFIDFESSWQVFDLRSMQRYLPQKFIMPNLRQWLVDAFVSGSVTRGTTRFTGQLDEFPFSGGEGVFRIEARLEDAVLRYSPNWPAPEFRHLEVIVDNMRLYSTENSAVNVGNVVEDARIDIPDLRAPVLEIEAFATGSMQSIRDYAISSPIDTVLGGQLSRIAVDGDASFDLNVTYPIQDKENYDFETRVRLRDGVVRVEGFPAPISELNGLVAITRNDVTSESLFGRFLGEPVDLALSRSQDAAAPYGVTLAAVGRTSAPALEAELGLPIGPLAWGEFAYSAEVRFPNRAAEAPAPLTIAVESDLFGFATELPAPFAKADDVTMPMMMSLEFPSPGEITTTGSLAGDVKWTARFEKPDATWDFDRGVLALGGDYPLAADVRGLHIHGQTPEVDLAEWLAIARRESGGLGIGERIRSIDIDVGYFFAVGQRFVNHRIRVDRSGEDWLIRLAGESADGQVTVPYDFAAGRPIMLEMERLVLPGNEDAAADEETGLDPRTLPAITINAADFGIGERRFGALDTAFEKTGRGLEAASLRAEDQTFTIEGTAGWIMDAYEASGQRTYLTGVLQSTNIERTMRRLGYEPGILGDTMRVQFDVGWPGGPGREFLPHLNGTVEVSLGPGRLEDVEPGAGRVFGLMSIVALPRRLALDFSDVFDTGFSFDQIVGSFRLVNGEAYTCNLTLTGTAADVGIVGRTSLPNREYEQVALVSANVGNTLPLVGGVIAGPQVAAALLVFSQIFKKPIQEMSQVYYAIDGGWDDPMIDTANPARFASASSLAGCIDANP